MSRRLLDTNALGDAVHRRRGVAERAEAARQAGLILGTATPALAELLGGAEASDTRDRNLPVVVRGVRKFRLWAFTAEAAREYARLYGELRRIGRKVPPVDLQIAAVARVLGNCTVVTVDGDFSAVPGLSVENWAS
ncbi:MAG: type II toxin-antitoxin system VapC family toxin [Gemmataceae bacterium]|nr:type II toxin-antitoxin system VapC family toxin [Gemmataceae bacterium]